MKCILEYKYDEIAFNNQNMLIIFSVGNEDCQQCVCNPATAKNVLSVGATTSSKWTLLERKSKRLYWLRYGDIKIPLKKLFWGSDPFDLSLSDSYYSFDDINLIESSKIKQNMNLSKTYIFVNQNVRCNFFSKYSPLGFILLENSNLVCKANTAAVFSIKEEDEDFLYDISSFSLHITPNIQRNEEDNFDIMKNSAEGPTKAGITKPDIVAPGHSIRSAAGNGSTTQKESCTKSKLITKSGTSSSTASIAALSAIVRQFFIQKWYPYKTPGTGIEINPSSSLIKACLISSAKPLFTPYGGPSNDLGFGIPNLNSIFNFELNMDSNEELKGFRIGDNIPIGIAAGFHCRMPVFLFCKFQKGNSEFRLK